MDSFGIDSVWEVRGLLIGSRSSWGARGAAAVLLAVVLVTIVWPGATVVWKVGQEIAGGRVGVASLVPSWKLLGSTVGWAAGIGVLATAIAMPGAWWVGRRGWGAAPFLCVPLLLPSYLTYAAFGLVRAPQSMLGDWIERRAQAGAEWLPVFAGRVVAVLGLSCWVWGVAALILAAGVRALPRDAIDALMMDRGSAGARWWHLARMLRGKIAAAVGAVALIMIGSAVPLHLADAPTYSVRVWYELSLAPGSAAAWVSAWPLIAVAVLGSLGVVRRAGAEPARGVDSPAGGGRVGGAMAMVVVAVSVVVPWAMLALSAGGARNFMNFWALSGEALGVSAAVAAGVGMMGSGLALCVWIGLASFSARTRAVVRAGVAVLLFGAFVPGVLVGQAVAMTWGWSARALDSPAMLVMGHVARFGAVAGLLGCWLAGAEGRPRRESRLLDGATGLLGFLRAAAPGRWVGVAGAGLVCACLSLHEIETSVFLQPPGVPSLAQTLLGYLHYSRMADLSAAAVWLVGMGLGLAALTAWLLSRAQESRTRLHPGGTRASTIHPENRA
ncbi:hypothetical protein PHYC_02448 [Phycisphaerales bacterium]|nr:hypothetical protein PHYC_02448 [Phycisphaerales bacterium]